MWIMHRLTVIKNYYLLIHPLLGINRNLVKHNQSGAIAFPSNRSLVMHALQDFLALSYTDLPPQS